MSSKLLQPARRWFVTLAAAALLALAAVATPLLIDTVVGTTLTPQAQACQHTGGGC